MTAPRRPWAPFGIAPRVARHAPTAWNVTKTLLQTAAMWAVFFVALPAAVFAAEDAAGFADWRIDPAPWRTPAVAVFVVCGAVGVWCGMTFAALGDGTPLPLDTVRKLVIAGPYRHVRNPMAFASIVQGGAVALWLGSPAVAVYVLLGLAVWNWGARPWEEADLAQRFGEPYERYRRNVACWRVRFRPYRPEDGAD